MQTGRTEDDRTAIDAAFARQSALARWAGRRFYDEVRAALGGEHDSRRSQLVAALLDAVRLHDVAGLEPSAAHDGALLRILQAHKANERRETVLLEALGRWLQQHHQLDLEGSAVLISAGSNMAFHAVAQVLCDPGDECLLPVPYYFNHAMAIQLAGGVPVAVEAGVIPDPERLAAAITPRTRAIVTVSPNNPSGAVLPRPVLEAINRLCADHGLLHISDEAYALFAHGDTAVWSPGQGSGSGAHGRRDVGPLVLGHGIRHQGRRCGTATRLRPLQVHGCTARRRRDNPSRAAHWRSSQRDAPLLRSAGVGFEPAAVAA